MFCALYILLAKKKSVFRWIDLLLEWSITDKEREECSFHSID